MGVVVGFVLFLVGFVLAAHAFITRKGNQMYATTNARQILGLMMTYASDNERRYPDHGRDLSKLTANEALRTLFQEGLVQDETIFGCPESPMQPDKNIGSAPGFEQAVLPGENHWILIAGLGNNSPAHYPAVMENAADASWPPKWVPYPESFFNSSNALRSRGMAWKRREIIVVFNDASVQTVKLQLRDGMLHLPESVLKTGGEMALPELKILDIE